MVSDHYYLRHAAASERQSCASHDDTVAMMLERMWQCRATTHPRVYGGYTLGGAFHVEVHYGTSIFVSLPMRSGHYISMPKYIHVPTTPTHVYMYLCH